MDAKSETTKAPEITDNGAICGRCGEKMEVVPALIPYAFCTNCCTVNKLEERGLKDGRNELFWIPIYHENSQKRP